MMTEIDARGARFVCEYCGYRTVSRSDAVRHALTCEGEDGLR